MTTYVSQSSRKYTFPNSALGCVAREFVLARIIPFDANKDGLLDQIQISNALQGIFGQSKSDIGNLTKHVLKYDSNRDGKVTYDEMANFFAECYFGELAVQKLQAKGVYTESGKKIMEENEFNKTIEHCLSFLDIKPEYSDLKQLFCDIDTAKRGHITYDEYFEFLKEYFGSESKAHKQIQAPKVNESLNIMKHSHVPLEQLNEKIGRLLFSQLRVLFMKYDFNRSLNFTKDEVRILLAQVFGLVVPEQQEFLRKVLPNADKIGYDELMRQTVLFYTCDVYFRGDNKDIKTIRSDYFVEVVKQAFFFIKVKPSPYDLEILFMKIDRDCDNRISKSEYVKMFQDLLRNYKFQPLVPLNQRKL